MGSVFCFLGSVLVELVAILAWNGGEGLPAAAFFFHNRYLISIVHNGLFIHHTRHFAASAFFRHGALFFFTAIHTQKIDFAHSSLA